MKQQNFDINKMRVASPCSVGWETMTGDERVRRCDSCELNIYNIAEMTKPEIVNLVKNHEGRLCIRLYKRADGTVLTKDCPVGFRAYQKRVARFAGAALATILGLFSVSFGQDNKSVNDGKTQTVKNEKENSESAISGSVIDSNKKALPETILELFTKDEYKKAKRIPLRKLKSNSAGNFIFTDLEPGVYILLAKRYGFGGSSNELTVVKGKETVVIIRLQPPENNYTVGTYGSEPLIDFNSTDITVTVFKRDN